MDSHTPSPAKKATCITEGVYSHALTYGKTYDILAHDKQKRQIRIHNDAGRTRWYPCGCFDLTGGSVPKLVRIVQHDPIETAEDWVEVEIELSDGQHRWCFFLTPTMLAQQTGDIITGSERLLSYHAPHMIVVSALSQEMIEQTLHFIERQGNILDCTRLMSHGEDNEDGI